jgi:hypothetical protein
MRRGSLVARCLLALAVAGASVGCLPPAHTSGSGSTGSYTTGQSKAGSSPTAVSAGSAVRDGKFEFQVLNITHASQAGDPGGNPYEQAKAQGEFIIVTLSVKNIGGEPQSYFGDNQKLIDSSGRQYSATSDADMFMNSNNGTGDINPGNSIQVSVAIDVPPGTVPSKLQLHDSAFSGGATVLLS